MYFDLPLDQLKTYLPPREEPADFDAFWAAPLAPRGNARWPRRSPRLIFGSVSFSKRKDQ